MNLVKIENKAGTVKLTEDINKFSVGKLIEDIGKLFGASAHASGADFGEITNCAENAVETLTLEINSPGGSIFDGYNISNEIRSLRERGVFVTARITGMAASMASVICMACDKVEMVPHGRMMIHEASQGVRGNSEELRKAADLLDSISQDIALMYSEKTGNTVETIREMMKAETWMTAPEALAAGFIDSIFDIRQPSTTKNSKSANPMSIFAKLFPGNDDALKIEAAILENDTLRNELEIAQGKIQELSGLSAIIAEKDVEIANLAAEKLSLENAAKEFQVTLAAKDDEIKAAKASVPVAVTETLAAIGQNEPLPEVETQAGPVHLTKFNSLKGAEATAYFKAHKKEIAAEQDALRKN